MSAPGMPLTVRLLSAPQLSPQDGVAQPFYVPFQHCHGGQCLAVGISYYPEGLLPGILLTILVTTTVFTYSLCLGMVFCCGRHPSGLPWLIWLGGTPPMMEVFSQQVQDLLAWSVLPPLDYLVPVQGSFSTGRPPGISQKFPPGWSCSPLTLQGGL